MELKYRVREHGTVGSEEWSSGKTKCMVCNQLIKDGETIFTAQLIEEPSVLSWGHADCMETLNEE